MWLSYDTIKQSSWWSDSKTIFLLGFSLCEAICLTSITVTSTVAHVAPLSLLGHYSCCYDTYQPWGFVCGQHGQSLVQQQQHVQPESTGKLLPTPTKDMLQTLNQYLQSHLPFVLSMQIHVHVIYHLTWCARSFNNKWNMQVNTETVLCQ